MSSNLNPVERMERLLGFVELIKTEMEDILAGLKTDSVQQTEEQQQRTIVAADELQKATLTLVSNQSTTAAFGANSTKLSSITDALSQHQQLFIKYLSPEVLNGGRGFIKPGVTFGQYDEDVMRGERTRLAGWPSGFYRNRETRETQLFINATDEHDHGFLFMLDNLPSNDGEFKVYRFDAPGDAPHVPLEKGADAIAADAAIMYEALERAFNGIMDVDFRT